MMQRIVLVLVLALVVGFGAGQVFGQGEQSRAVSESGEQLDAALGVAAASPVGGRWYDNPTTIGLMAGGTVFVVGVIAAVTIKPPAGPKAGDERETRAY